jgi:hypothetical protein
MKSVTYTKWMFEDFQDILLILNVVDVFGLDDVVLLHCLYRVLLSGVALEPANLDVAERACT